MAPGRARLPAGEPIQAFAIVDAQPGELFDFPTLEQGADERDVEVAVRADREVIAGREIGAGSLEMAGVLVGGNDVAVGTEQNARHRIPMEQVAEEVRTGRDALTDD